MENRPKTLVVTRHGETEWNTVADAVRSNKMRIPKHLEGVPNYRILLSEVGRMQATATGKKLAERHGSFDSVYYSPYLRAEETKDIIVRQFPDAERRQMEARLFGNLFLVEQNPGELDPSLADNLDEQQRLYQRYQEQAKKYGHFYLQSAGVESWSQVALRVHLFLQTLYQQKHHDENLLIVTHGVTTLLFRYLLEGLSEAEVEVIHEKDHPRNCGVYTYKWNDAANCYETAGSNEIFY